MDDRLDGATLGPQSISHHLYTSDGSKLMVTTYGVASPNTGKLLIIDANTHTLDMVLPVAKSAHGIAYAGDMR